MYRRSVLLPVLLLALAARIAAAEERFTSITLENDFFVFHGTDGHYTNGLQLAFTATPEVVAAVGQRIFTPTKTYLDPPDPRDRPYAGWVYAMGDGCTRFEPALHDLTVTAGVVGPAALAKQAQDLVHHLLNETPSRGWS